MQSSKPHLNNNNKGGKKGDGKPKVIKSKKIEKIETNYKTFEMSILFDSNAQILTNRITILFP